MEIYKTGIFTKNLIEPVEVERITDKSVWIDGTAIRKRSNYDNYWNTIEEAKEYLTEKYNRIIESSESKIEKAKYNLEQLSRF